MNIPKKLSYAVFGAILPIAIFLMVVSIAGMPEFDPDPSRYSDSGGPIWRFGLFILSLVSSGCCFIYGATKDSEDEFRERQDKEQKERREYELEIHRENLQEHNQTQMTTLMNSLNRLSDLMKQTLKALDRVENLDNKIPDEETTSLERTCCRKGGKGKRA